MPSTYGVGDAGPAPAASHLLCRSLVAEMEFFNALRLDLTSGRSSNGWALSTSRSANSVAKSACTANATSSPKSELEPPSLSWVSLIQGAVYERDVASVETLSPTVGEQTRRAPALGGKGPSLSTVRHIRSIFREISSSFSSLKEALVATQPRTYVWSLTTLAIPSLVFV